MTPFLLARSNVGRRYTGDYPNIIEWLELGFVIDFPINMTKGYNTPVSWINNFVRYPLCFELSYMECEQFTRPFIKE